MKNLKKLKELFKQYENIGEEVSIINKLKSAIANDGKLDDDNDELISYYDLLSFLRFGITFKKVLYQKFDKEEIYYYDDEEIITENDNQKKESIKQEINYTAVIEIPSINLKRGVVDSTSNFNSINYAISVDKNSNYPILKI